VEKTAEADRAHAAFNDPASDFLTLLAIWKRFRQARQEAGSQSALKRFCREHFLSYRRMREWEDIHQQIGEVLKEFGIRKAEGGRMKTGGNEAGPSASPVPASVFSLQSSAYGQIHRSILSGFLANIAFKKDKNLYRAAKDREVMIFPGSGLFNAAGSWIVAAEMVETSRLFARTVASIDPGWLEKLGAGLCRSTYRDPRWDPRHGEVVATEQVTLFGLVILPGRTVSYGRIKPDEATEIFIRQALVSGNAGRHLAFLEHNQEQVAKVLELENRLRRRDLLVDDEAHAAFYRKRLATVYDLRSLAQLIKTKGGDGFLRMAAEDLMNYRPDEGEVALFPERLTAAGHALELRYRFEPAADDDGVTLRVPSTLAAGVPPSTLEWLVPGLLREKVEALVKGLPKALRRRLVPLNETVNAVLAEMSLQQGPFLTALAEFIRRRFGVDIPASAWPGAALPDHLKMRVAITAPDDRELISGRDPALLRSTPAAARIPPEVRHRWERSGITRWDFGDLPEVLSGEGLPHAPWVAYPGLEPAGSGVRLKLFARRDLASAAHPRGVAALAGIELSRDLRFLKRSLALPEEVQQAARYFGGARKVEEAMAERVIRDLFAVNLRTQKEFAARVANYAPKIIPAGRELLYGVIPVLQAYALAHRDVAALAGGKGPLAGICGQLEADLTHLMPQNFIALYDLSRLPHLERYLRALAVRAQRALLDPEKDRLKAQQPQKFSQRLKGLLETLNPESSAEKRRAVEELFWMIEEYKVSIFAQELKTARPVSPKRLEEKIAEIERMT
jgi:ATP-dependent helicase HrpA